jgi:class 3 adenylate cyclase
MRDNTMTAEGLKRKLAAILSADVESYSRLMADDEESTIRTLTVYRSAMTDLIQQHRGRVVDVLRATTCWLTSPARWMPAHRFLSSPSKRHAHAAAAREASTAVLPFEVTGGDENQQYFADGLNILALLI